MFDLLGGEGGNGGRGGLSASQRNYSNNNLSRNKKPKEMLLQRPESLWWRREPRRRWIRARPRRRRRQPAWTPGWVAAIEEEPDRREGHRCCLGDGIHSIPSQTRTIWRKVWTDALKNGYFRKLDDLVQSHQAITLPKWMFFQKISSNNPCF